MKTSKHNKIKHVLVNILGIASLALFPYSTLIAKELSTIANGDLGSGRIKAETVKPNKETSTIANVDLGSGRIKAEKVKPNKSTK